MPLPLLDSDSILALRPTIERPRPGTTPLDVLYEQEATGSGGGVADLLTILLRGSECAFRCLMCDLWKSTHREATPPGYIAAQVEHAVRETLERATPATWVKLYNASNFFSNVNVPTGDLKRIATSVSRFQRVVVENHPRLLNKTITEFRDSIGGKLEVAMGLETVHPEVLAKLNKRMDLDDFRHACEWLTHKNIDLRVFILLRPPGLSEPEGVEWCCRSIEFARQNGARHVSIIPVRSGNGAIEHLQSMGCFEPPLARSLEWVVNQYVAVSDMVVTADLWEWNQLRGLCSQCSQNRLIRMQQVNLQQRAVPQAECDCTIG